MKLTPFVSLVVVVLAVAVFDMTAPKSAVNSKHQWSYTGPEGPDSWGRYYKDCAGTSQSPIDIHTQNTVFDPTLGTFRLEHFNTYSERNGPTLLNITNNGHAASVRVTSNMQVTGGGLDGTYKTAEFHFHWGSTDDLGSEHALDGRKFPLEMHVVNFAEKYGTIQKAMKEPDGLAVLGVMFQLSDYDNPEFASLDHALRYVYKKGEHNLVDRLKLRALLPEDISRYWRYSGSLTTPYCFESVIWTVFATPSKISRRQLAKFRSLLHHDSNGGGTNHGDSHTLPSRLVDNWRPLQPINNRIVRRSFYDSSMTQIAKRVIVDMKSQGQVPNFPPFLGRLKSARKQPTILSKALNSDPSNSVGRKNRDSLMSPSGLSGPTLTNSTDRFPSSTMDIKVAPSPLSYVDRRVKSGIEIKIVKSPPSRQTRNESLSFNFNDKYDINSLREIQQLEKQQKFLEIRKQQLKQQQQELHQRHQQLKRQRALNIQQQRPLVDSASSTAFGARLKTPTMKTSAVDASVSPRGDMQTANSSHTGRSPASRVMRPNDRVAPRIQTGRGGQSNPLTRLLSIRQTTNAKFPDTDPSYKIASNLSQVQNTSRYVAPLDPNFKLTFVNDEHLQQIQQKYPQQHRQHQHSLPTRIQTQPSVWQSRSNHGENKKSLFSKLFNQQTTTQPKVFQGIDNQEPSLLLPQQFQVQKHQRASPVARQQPQIVRTGTKLTADQLRGILEKLATPNRVQSGDQTLFSAASRVMASPVAKNVNSVTRNGNSDSQRPRSNTRPAIMNTARLANPLNGDTKSVINSGRNPVPRSSQPIPRRQISSENFALSQTQSDSLPSISLPSSAFSGAQSPNYRIARPQSRARAVPLSQGGSENRNWFFTDMDGSKGQQETIPYVFLHRMQKPVRIRRPFYEKLYTI